MAQGKKIEPSSAADDPIIVSAKGVLRASVIGLFLIAFVGTLYFAQDLLIPIALAFLFSILLSPIVRFFARVGVPHAVTSIGLVVALLAIIAAGAWSLSGPVVQWIDDAPRIGFEIREKIAGLRASLGFVQEVNEQVEEISGEEDPTVQEVVVKEPGLLNRAATGVPEIVAKVGLTLVLLLFLLSSGDMFREKLVKVLPTLSDKKRAVHIVRDVEREVSRYLLTITAINIATGIAVGLGLWAIGMPNPLLWGVLAAFLTYIPYLGALIGISLVGAVAVVSFEALGQALLAPSVYLIVSIFEGQLLTPMIVGRRLEMNAVAILIAVAFWGWLWGVVGILIAVPLLVTIKVFSDHVEGLDAVGQFLAARDLSPMEQAEAEEEAARKAAA